MSLAIAALPAGAGTIDCEARTDGVTTIPTSPAIYVVQETALGSIYVYLEDNGVDGLQDGAPHFLMVGAIGPLYHHSPDSPSVCSAGPDELIL